MKKIIFVESADIGKFSFQGFIVDKGDNIVSYSIFIKNMDVALIELVAYPNKDVRLCINNEMISYIEENKTQDKKLRREYFKQFYSFIIASEKKASYMIFKRQKLNYIKNSSDIINMKKLYIGM
ncbi:MAG: hypothetical protein ACI35V_07820 [Sphingobacterium composti]|uniref:hypothetical protein n=1 Tax=Sphingobacterium composti TaxID=363260 RepID=UPI00135BA576|nr:hypothetical protein [Sphingobacterium composti Ten et al. 2007 non Yoo et al. 2007]